MIYSTVSVAFVNLIETMLLVISPNSDLWSSVLGKTVITTTFYFPAKEESLCIRKK